MARSEHWRNAPSYFMLLLIVATLVTLALYWSVDEVPPTYRNTPRPITLSRAWLRFFDAFSFAVPVLVVDADLLRSIFDEMTPPPRPKKLNSTLTVAVDEKFRGAKISAHDDKLRVIYYGKSRSTRDYWLFDKGNEKGAMLPFDVTSFSLVSVPSDIPTFLDDWNLSRFIDCTVMLERDGNEKRKIPLSFVSHMADLRNFIKERRARLILSSGSLLGWYRECSMIPHSKDVDFFIRAEEHNPAIIEDIDASSSPYSLTRIYGKPTDSYELGVKVKKAPDVNIDLFYLYTTEDESYFGGLEWTTRKKFKWSYPRITSLCTGDLLGHLFHVPCNVTEVLDVTYGGNWSADHRSADFDWRKWPAKENGEFTMEEMRGMRVTLTWGEWIKSLLH